MKIEIYDRVRDKNRIINGGVDMPVKKVLHDKSLCTYLDPKDNEFKDGWFLLSELEIVHKSDKN